MQSFFTASAIALTWISRIISSPPYSFNFSPSSLTAPTDFFRRRAASPPCRNLPRDSLRQQSRRSTPDPGARDSAPAGSYNFNFSTSSLTAPTDFFRRRGASPPCRNLPPRFVAPAKPALDPRSGRARLGTSRLLQLQLLHQLPHGANRFLEGLALVRGQLDLDDLLHSCAAKLHGNAHVDARDAVLAIEVGRAREDLLLIFQNGLDHLHSGGSGRVVRAARLEQAHDLGAAIGGARDQRLDPIGRQQVG